MRLSKILLLDLLMTGERALSSRSIFLTLMFSLGRFGLQALKWKNFHTMQEYLSHGMTQSVAYYVVSFCVLIFWNRISPRDLAFVSAHPTLVVVLLRVAMQWNYLLLAWTFAQELHFLPASFQSFFCKAISSITTYSW